MVGVRRLSWICSTLTECRFRYFVPVNDIYSLPEFRYAQYVRKSAKRKLFAVVLHIQKKEALRLLFLYMVPHIEKFSKQIVVELYQLYELRNVA